MSKIRSCIHCEREYELSPNKPGMINTCWQCGEEEDKNTPRLGGVLEFEHKTAPTLKIMSLEDAQTIKRKTDRVGGQGIIKGLATQR